MPTGTGLAGVGGVVRRVVLVMRSDASLDDIDAVLRLTRMVRFARNAVAVFHLLVVWIDQADFQISLGRERSTAYCLAVLPMVAPHFMAYRAGSGQVIFEPFELAQRFFQMPFKSLQLVLGLFHFLVQHG